LFVCFVLFCFGGGRIGNFVYIQKQMCFFGVEVGNSLFSYEN